MKQNEIIEKVNLIESIENGLKKLDLYFYEVRGHKPTSKARKKISKIERDIRAIQDKYTIYGD